MRWPWQAAPLVQQNTAPTKCTCEERIEKLERAMKHMETDWEDWYNKYRTLYARIARAQERAEQRPQQAAGATIDVPEGVTPPPPPTRDNWTALRNFKRSRGA